MGDKLKPYDGHKETDQLWLAQIPSNWNMIKIKHLFSERIEKGYPNEVLLVASQNMGVVPKNVYGNRTVEATKDLHLLKLVKEGDFVISLRSFQGGIEYAYYQGIISPAYTVMIPRGVVTAGYFRHLAKSKAFIELLQMCVTGIREGQNIDYNKLKHYRLPVPPKEEQNQIVRYLDWKLSKINKFIKAKKKQIELLKEQKQVIISKAVTRGINTNRPLIDSGIDWLGYIDSSTTLQRLKDAFTWHAGGAWGIDSQGDKNDRICIRVADFSYDNFNLRINEDMTIRNYPQAAINKLELEKHMILIEKSGGGEKAPVGRAVIFDTDVNALYANFIEGFRVSEEYSPRYVVYWLANMYTKGVSRKNLKFTTGIQNLDIQLYISEPIIKRSLYEQDLIVKYLDETIYIIERLKDKLIKEIDLITEYRTSLISDVVTGKVDIRNIVVGNYSDEDFEPEEIDESYEEISDSGELDTEEV